MKAFCRQETSKAPAWGLLQRTLSQQKRRKCTSNVSAAIFGAPLHFDNVFYDNVMYGYCFGDSKPSFTCDILCMIDQPIRSNPPCWFGVWVEKMILALQWHEVLMVCGLYMTLPWRGPRWRPLCSRGTGPHIGPSSPSYRRVVPLSHSTNETEHNHTHSTYTEHKTPNNRIEHRSYKLYSCSWLDIDIVVYIVPLFMYIVLAVCVRTCMCV